MNLALKTVLKSSALVAALSAPLMAHAAPLPTNAQMDVEFEIPYIKASPYARPYIAVWIEDANRKPIRTIELWVCKDEWLKDLRTWWRKVGRYDRELVDAVTSATRTVGEYRFTWDGLDDSGERVEQGEYTFYAESVREHGGRSVIRQKLNLADKPFKIDIKPAVEIGNVALTYKIK